MNSTQDEGENILRDPPPSEGPENISIQEPYPPVPIDDDTPNIIPLTQDALISDEGLQETPGVRDLPDLPNGGPEAAHTELQDGVTNGLDGIVSFPGQVADYSNDGSFSTPDDTPSAQDSLLSSPHSETASLRSPLRRGSPSNVHRPFDTRFQSRLSSAQFSPLRPASPAFLGSHSRHSSAISFAFQPPSEPDDTASPWDVIRWNKFKKITGQAFSEIGKRNFGMPTCLAATDQLVIGTSKGLVLVFDQQQNHKAIIGSGTKAAESGAVSSIAISADHSTIAVGHSTGHIFTWELARPTRPFLHIQPIDNSQPQARRGDGHITGSAVPHIGFLGYRHTALVSADDKGMAFSHLATRGMGAVGRVVRTTRILGRYPEVIDRATKPLRKSSVLAFSPLPLGNIEQRTDGLGLVAMLTPYLLVIVSTTPIAQTQHKAARPKEVAAHSAMTAALAWFPAIKLKAQDTEVSKTKLVYAWSNILTILEVHEAHSEDERDKDKPPELQFLARSRFQADEAIVAVQWLNRSVIAVLTITQQLLIIEDVTMHVTEAFDLLKKNIYHSDLYSQQLLSIIEQLDEEDTSMHGVVADAFHMSFRAYKGRLFLLGFNDIWIGALTNWADRLLALMNIGDFIGAIRLATRYYTGVGEKSTIGLPEEDILRFEMVKERLSEMMAASLKYAFGKNQQAGNEPIEKPQMIELAEACLKACLVMQDLDFLFEEVFAWFDDNDEGQLFVDLLEPYILDRTIVSLPPPVLKTMIDHFVITHTPSTLEEIICMLETSTMDLDQITTLCRQHNLYDAYIYVWTMALRDFTTPLILLLGFAESDPSSSIIPTSSADYYQIAQKIFPYISFILTGRVYPTGLDMTDDESNQAKSQIYDFFFSGKSAANGVAKNASEATIVNKTAESFERLAQILHFDAPSFIAALNEAFEDSFLNLGDEDALSDSQASQSPMTRIYTRQYVLRIMLEVMTSEFEAEDTIYLDMFIARNLGKFPQYIILSGTILHQVLSRLCKYPEEGMRDDAQLSVEYLLSIYQPPNILEFVSLLQDAHFYRVLKSVFKQEHHFAEMIHTYFLDTESQEDVFAAIVDCLKISSRLVEEQRLEVRKVIEEHAGDLVDIDIEKTALAMDEIAQDLHQTFLNVLSEDEYGQYTYLRVLLDHKDRPGLRQEYSHSFKELYIRLLCQFDSGHVRDYVEHVKAGDLRLEEVLPTIEESGIIDAVVILQAQQGHVKEAMKRLSRHLSFLGTTLKAVTSESIGDTDEGSIRHPVTGLLESVEKYAQIGTWLCQAQMKNAPKATGPAKSPRRAVSATRALGFEEELWLELIISVVTIARDLSMGSSKEQTDQEADVTTSLRTVIQQVFTALLVNTTSVRESSGARDMMFLRILRAFLTHAAESSLSLSELRNVISSIFSAYAYEESLLALSNSMLDKDVFVRLDEVTALRQRGWRPRGQVCEVCRRRVWGPGIGVRVWEEWQQKEEGRSQRRHGVQSEVEPDDEDVGRGKGKATIGVNREEPSEEERSNGGGETLGPVVVFSCRHLYHQKCLVPGQMEDGSLRHLCPACA